MIRPYRPEDLEALKRITAICFEGVSIDRNIEERFGRIGDRDCICFRHGHRSAWAGARR